MPKLLYYRAVAIVLLQVVMPEIPADFVSRQLYVNDLLMDLL